MTLQRKGTDMYLIILILLAIFAPYYLIIGAGYLVQKYRFGIPFKETYAYHREQDALERKRK